MTRALDTRGVPAVAIALALLLLAGGGCASREKRAAAVGFVPAEQLYRQGLESLNKHDLLKARKTFEQVDYRTTEDRTELEPLVRLAMADATFYRDSTLSFIDARSMYLDFVTLYVDHPRAPYAQLQAGVCSLKQGNDPARDQTQTLFAIKDLRVVLRRYPDSPYARAAQDMIDTAQTKLAEHEFLVGKFYLSKKSYEAAATRFKIIVEQYPRYPDKQKLYFHLGRALVLGGNDAEGKIYLDKLIQDYPDGEFTGAASKLLEE